LGGKVSNEIKERLEIGYPVAGRQPANGPASKPTLDPPLLGCQLKEVSVKGSNLCMRFFFLREEKKQKQKKSRTAYTHNPIRTSYRHFLQLEAQHHDHYTKRCQRYCS